jgi:protein phosphatase
MVWGNLFRFRMTLDPLSFAMLSDPGRTRAHNEDACAADAEHLVFVVCDGVGGAASGEIASRLAAETFVAQLISPEPAGTSHEAGMRRGVEEANRAVQRHARTSVTLRGMATTMVALVFYPADGYPAEGRTEGRTEGERELSNDEVDTAGTVWLANVGDSRCYRLRQGRLEQLTEDHSIVEEQVRAGEMTRAQADVSPIRNVITRAIGSEATVAADVQSLPARHGDLYLLCTDGLMRELSDERIAGILLAKTGQDEHQHPDEAVLADLCAELIGAANLSGGGDNITCLLIAIR